LKRSRAVGNARSDSDTAVEALHAWRQGRTGGKRLKRPGAAWVGKGVDREPKADPKPAAGFSTHAICYIPDISPLPVNGPLF